jgi:two-component system, OmpR family, KDP operon response regulator KdpE
VVEDEPAPLKMLDASLSARHYRVLAANTGRQALELLDQEEPDLVIVDLGLPDIDGLELCRHIRVRTASPIIVVTADGREDRMVQALDEGADDYVIKPFSMPELLARVRVGVRRRIALSAIIDEDLIEVGALRIDTSGFLVAIAGRPVTLPRRQFLLLTHLARNAGRIVTYRALTRQLWGPDHEAATLKPLRVLVSNLRQSLGEGPGVPHILNETHIGYRLIESDGLSE